MFGYLLPTRISELGSRALDRASGLLRRDTSTAVLDPEPQGDTTGFNTDRRSFLRLSGTALAAGVVGGFTVPGLTGESEAAPPQIAITAQELAEFGRKYPTKKAVLKELSTQNDRLLAIAAKAYPGSRINEYNDITYRQFQQLKQREEGDPLKAKLYTHYTFPSTDNAAASDIVKLVRDVKEHEASIKSQERWLVLGKKNAAGMTGQTKQETLAGIEKEETELAQYKEEVERLKDAIDMLSKMIPIDQEGNGRDLAGTAAIRKSLGERLQRGFVHIAPERIGTTFFEVDKTLEFFNKRASWQ